jgi:hypothetical protein
MLPENAHAFAARGELPALLKQIDDGHGEHDGLLSERFGVTKWNTE